jgi:hypothetical protein
MYVVKHPKAIINSLVLDSTRWPVAKMLCQLTNGFKDCEGAEGKQFGEE